jgi:hypothetical protein
MKNLLVFINPLKTFEGADYYKEIHILAKLQIDNSLAFGWKREDIMMVTNFPYEYNGVQAIVVPDETFDATKNTVSKINGILALFDMGLITDELFWFHDFDAFQNAPLGEVTLGDKVLALTNTTVDDSRLSTGVLFFSQSARDLFTQLQQKCQENLVNEEVGLRLLLADQPQLQDQLLLLNISHNFAIRKRPVADQYQQAEKPIKVLHFHPTDKRLCDSEPTKNSLEVVYGHNSLGESLLGGELEASFCKYGLTV